MEPRRHSPAHLLWAVPLGVIIALVMVLGATISWCGISGCSGGGFGVTTSMRPTAVVMLVGSGLAVGAPFAFVRWTLARAPRLVLAGCVAAAWALLAWAVVASAS